MINDGDMSVMCQVCRSGMVQHLQHLLLYGADRNARNASGNTPLHVCAVNNKVSDLDRIMLRITVHRGEIFRMIVPKCYSIGARTRNA